MNTRMVTLVATIAVIALVAVGIGYAYQATIQNSGNEVTVNYLVIDADPATKLVNTAVAVQWDSETTASNVVKYTPVSATTINIGTEQNSNNVKAKAIGDPYSLKVEVAKLADGDTFNLSMTAKIGEVTANLGSQYMLKVNDGTSDSYFVLSNSASYNLYGGNSHPNADVTFTLTLYAIEFIGTTADATPTVIQPITGNITFAFTATSAAVS